MMWDIIITSLIVSAAAWYVAVNIHKTISNALHGRCGGCSACAQCQLAGNEEESIGDRMARAIAEGKKRPSA